MEALPKTTRDGTPLTVRVYEALRDSIASGEMAADAQLLQEELANALGVSRTPVRYALDRLAHEGLVVAVPGGGYLVNQPTEKDVLELHQVRLNLELLALRLACGRHNTLSLSLLNTVIAEMSVVDPTDLLRRFELNVRFHRLLIEPCGNHILLRLIDGLSEHQVNRRIALSHSADTASVDRGVQEHRALLDAVTASDLDKLLDLYEQHLAKWCDDALAALSTP